MMLKQPEHFYQIQLIQNKQLTMLHKLLMAAKVNRIPVTINIQNTLAPTGDTNQPFCTGQNPTIANIQVTGNLIKWYDAATNGFLLPETTNLEDGKTYYASQTINNCESPKIWSYSFNCKYSFCSNRKCKSVILQKRKCNIK